MRIGGREEIREGKKLKLHHMCEWINFHRCRQFRVHSIDFLRLASRFLWDFPPTFFHKLLPSFLGFASEPFSPSTAATMAAVRTFYVFDIGGFCSIFFTPFHLSHKMLMVGFLAQLAGSPVNPSNRSHHPSGPDSWDKWENLLFCVYEKMKNSGRLFWILSRWEWGKHWAKMWAEMAKKGSLTSSYSCSA